MPRFHALAAALLAAALAASCSAPPKEGPGAGDARTLGIAGEPVYGGTLIFGKGRDATRLDPADTTDGESSIVTENVFDKLIHFQEDSTALEPGLATSWDVAPDGKAYTFHLRRGVTFHDGTPFDAPAVAINFERQRKPLEGQQFEFWQSFFEPVVDAVTVIDPLTVRVTLKEHDATFLSNLAMFSMGMVSPASLARYGADVSRHPVGTGPFRFVKWEPNQKIVLEANEAYWGGRPYLDKLIFKPVPENAVRLLELEVGAIHGMSGLNPDDTARVEENAELSFLQEPGMNIGYLAMNNDRKPFDQVKVRQALNHAINKPALIRAFFADGRLGEAAKNPMPPTLWGYNDAIRDYAYDPARAKRLLAEAGYPQGFEMELWALPVVRPYMPQGQRVAEAIQSDLAKIGVTVRITTYEWGTYLDKLGKGDHQAALIGWIGDNGDPDNFLYNLLDASNARKGGSTNYAFYRGQEAHRLLLKARRVSDPAARTRLYEEAQVAIHRDAPWVPLFHAKQMAAVRANVRGFTLHPTGKAHFARAWFAPPTMREETP
jgi:peptide/nickel transport system substrate-binding protein